MNQNNQLTKAEKKEVQEEKRVVFFEGNSWYHRTKELMDDLTCILRSLADSDAFQSGRSAAIADSIINSFWYQWQGLSPAL